MIRPDALASMLDKAARSGLPPIAWISSDEGLLQIEAADGFRAVARGLGYVERQIFHVDRHFRLDELMQEANSLSLFASRKLLELRLVGKPGKELGEALAESAPGLPDDVRLLVTGPKLERTATDAAWFARLDRAGWMIAIPEVGRARLPGWIAERLARGGQQADAATLQAIAERVEGNLLAAEQEVRKLALLFPAGRLDADAVRAVVLDVARWDAFDLVGAAMDGDVARALRCLHGLRAEGTAVPMVVWALADGIRTLARVSAAREAGRPLQRALSDARVWGADRERSYSRALARLQHGRIRALLRACARIDRMTKGILAGDDWLALEAVVLGLAGVRSLGLEADRVLAA
jgi:DNA polymerase-3 subunit delta